MNVDCARVPLAHGVRGVHGANQGAVFSVDELVGSAAGAADIDQVGGGFGVRPVPAVRAATQISLLHQAVQQCGGVRPEQAQLFGADGCLLRGGAQLR